VLEHSAVSDKDKDQVKKNKASMDIVNLQENLEKACDELGYIACKNYAAPLGQLNG